MTSPNHPVSSTAPVKITKERPESPRVDKNPLILKKPETKVLPVAKKPSLQVDIKNISSPRNGKEDSAMMKSPDQKTIKNVSGQLNKEDLRTTFTPTSFAPKNFDAKDSLRKTTLAPSRLPESKLIELEKIKQDMEAKTPNIDMKKHTFEKRQ